MSKPTFNNVNIAVPRQKSVVACSSNREILLWNKGVEHGSRQGCMHVTWVKKWKSARAKPQVWSQLSNVHKPLSRAALDASQNDVNSGVLHCCPSVHSAHSAHYRKPDRTKPFTQVLIARA
jgi:hypothetical protein